MSTIKTRTIKGGEFIIRETACEDIFIPEEFDEEHKKAKQRREEKEKKGGWF